MFMLFSSTFYYVFVLYVFKSVERKFQSLQEQRSQKTNVNMFFRIQQKKFGDVFVCLLIFSFILCLFFSTKWDREIYLGSIHRHFMLCVVYEHTLERNSRLESRSSMIRYYTVLCCFTVLTTILSSVISFLHFHFAHRQAQSEVFNMHTQRLYDNIKWDVFIEINMIPKYNSLEDNSCVCVNG